MKVFAYIRKSTDDKRLQTHSLAYQREEILRAFKGEYDKIDFFEASESAAKTGRKSFSELLRIIEHEIKQGEQVILLAHAVDRLTRNLFDLAKLEELRQQGLKIRTCGSDFEGDSALLNLSIQAIFATDFVGKLKSKMNSAYEQGAREGKSFFGVPLGYQAGEIKGIRKPHPEKSKAIKRIFKEFVASDQGTSEFTPKAKEIGKIYGVRIMNPTSLSYILRNSFYMGVIQYNGVEYQGAHKPIISQDLFLKVQEKLDGKRHFKVVRHNFLFRRKIKCSCGRIMTGETQKGFVYYRCHNKKCTQKPLKERLINKYIEDFLQQNQLSPETVHAILQKIKEGKKEIIKNIQYTRKGLTQRLNKSEQRLDKLNDMYLDMEYNKEEYQALKMRLLKEQKSIKEEIQRSNSEWFINVIDTAEKMFELIKNRLLSWKTADIEKKRWILDLLGSNFFINSEKRLQIEISPLFITLISSQKTVWLLGLDSNQ